MTDIFAHDPLHDPSPNPPESGWTPATCDFKDHKWVLEIDHGHVSVRCVDPCEGQFDPAARIPTCHADWQPEDYCTPYQEEIPVELTFIDDSSPSTPDGPAEYGFWIELRVAPSSEEAASDGR